MCEHFVARAAEPFPLGELWPLAERLERYGLAGFGWGAAWVGSGGRLEGHRSTLAFRDDFARDALAREETTSLLVHLRRPSKLSTLAMPDTQPFLDPDARFAFSHNGDLREIRSWRERYKADGRIHGRADSEVGQRWLEDGWSPGGHAPRLLRELHECMRGSANFALLEPDGSAYHYAGNPENPVFSFRLGPIGLVSTGLYSIDRSVFRLAAPSATERRLVRPGRVVGLDRDGTPSPAS